MYLERMSDNVLTFKDLSLLSDMFQSCCDAYKRMIFSMNFIESSDVLIVYKESVNLFGDKLRLMMWILRKSKGNF